MSNSQGYEVKCEAPRTLQVLNAESCQALSSPNKNHDFTATQGNCYSLNKWLCKRFRYDRRRTRNLVTCYPTTRNSLTRIRLHKYKLKSGLWCQILINSSQNTNLNLSEINSFCWTRTEGFTPPWLWPCCFLKIEKYLSLVMSQSWMSLLR